MSEQKQQRSLRDAFGQFATGITVVTTLDKNEKPVGLTANSFSSVSLEPPLVSWCIDKSSTRFSEFTQAPYFTISVLTAEQQAISDLFAYRSADGDAFDDIQWTVGHHGVPQLNDVSARFHCKAAQLIEAGDHVIILGAVEGFDSESAEPLIFSQGKYRTLSSDN